MKLFFDASLRGKRLYETEYLAIRDALLRLGHELIAYPLDMSSPEKVAMETEEESEGYYRKLLDWIGRCDVAVYEVSYPSIGIGHEISLSLDKGRPVIVLHVRGKRPYILESRRDDRLHVVEYDLEVLNDELRHCMELVEDQLESRFTMILDGETRRLLDEVAENGETRSEYVRRLIKEDAERRGK